MMRAAMIRTKRATPIRCVRSTGRPPLGWSPSTETTAITATAIPAGEVNAAFGHSWASGMLNTRGSFEQQYGYFELRAQLPNAPMTIWAR